MAEASWQRGQLVEFDGRHAVIVGIDTDPWVPQDHLALWFGEPQTAGQSKNGPSMLRPEVWIVPAEYCILAAEPEVRH